MSKEEQISELRTKYHELYTCKCLIASLEGATRDADFSLRCLDNSASAVEEYAEPFDIPGYSDLLNFEEIKYDQPLCDNFIAELDSIWSQLNTIGYKIDIQMSRISSQIDELNN